MVSSNPPIPQTFPTVQMPSPKHPCSHPGCTAMVARKEAKTCKKHYFKTPEHLANIKAAIQDLTRSEQHKKSISEGRIRSFKQKHGRTSDRICEYCEKPFKVERPSRKDRFCSQACGYAQRQGEAAKNWKTDIPMYTCVICGKTGRNTERRQTKSTCSYVCKNILQRKRQKTKGTDIERAMEAAIKTKGWEYTPQHGVPRIATVDFFLPKANIIIFCDGDYWHSLPQKVERDKRQTEQLRKRGYVVHRFWGSEILADVGKCVKLIESDPSFHS